MKVYVHVHEGKKQAFFRTVGEGRSSKADVILRVTYGITGKAEVTAEDLEDINMNMLAKDKTVFEILSKAVQAVEYSKRYLCPGAINPAIRGDLEKQDCVVHKRYSNCFRTGMTEYYKKEGLSGASLKKAVDKLNYAMVVFADFPPGTYTNKKGKKRDRTNINHKKMPVLMMCDESADEFYLGLPQISIEFRRYEGRNTTVMPVLGSRNPPNIELAKKAYKAHANRC